ncbi:MAG: UPF0175 family protein [Saprospiraceae bacterium]
MVLTISDEILGPLQLTEEEVLLELAVAFYANGKLSFGKARQLAGLNWVQFRKELARYNVPSHYNQADFEADLASIDLISVL